MTDTPSKSSPLDEIMAAAMWADTNEAPAEQFAREHPNDRAIYLENVTAALKALNAAGFKVVPVDPTDRMVRAGVGRSCQIITTDADVEATEVYRAMVRAA